MSGRRLTLPAQKRNGSLRLAGPSPACLAMVGLSGFQRCDIPHVYDCRLFPRHNLPGHASRVRNQGQMRRGHDSAGGACR